VIYWGVRRAAQVQFGNRKTQHYKIVTIDPYDGAVLKTADMNADFLHIIFSLHYRLCMRPDNARSVYVELLDRSLSRAQLNSPGIGNEQWQGTRKKELHFQPPAMKAGETIDAWAVLSDEPVRNRGYSWSGEPAMNRRLSCVQCHQGIGFPTTEYLRQEHAAIEADRELPTWDLPTILPTTKGRDFRWHPQIQEYAVKRCCESREKGRE
jgi:hypothetical protein